jgi:hypothetical protein
VADQKALDSYKARLKKSRANAKQNKGSIMSGLRSYAQYGPQNPFNNVLSDAELDALKAEDLVNVFMIYSTLSIKFFITVRNQPTK